MFNPQPKQGKKKKKKHCIDKKLAISVFERDNYTCKNPKCQKLYTEDNHALHPHHIIFRSQSGKDMIGNLISLCWECHRLLHDRKIQITFD